MGTMPEVAAAHFAAIMDKAREARAKIDAACDADPGEDIDAFIDSDEACEALIELILDSPATPCLMLALAAPAGAA